ncbi:metallophosphoesterase family protein [Paenibacillus sp. 1001270B_150601_E10]|uniref:metallophosphoesterase family protein n=1 Tax=Paenibacillus sp. 1001270B_150601_E10 TaxID=2787079 RepID=UPI00189D4175|nr:DNA repair exonuclease [Paenibacillus sp. 1001270B_150601_E10]
MKFRFVHAADLHLDSPFKGLVDLPDALREQVLQSTFNAWDNLVELVLRCKADALLLSGDIFDASHRSLRAEWRLLKGIERLGEASVQVYIIHGNHDPLTAEKAWSAPMHVHVFGTEKPESYPLYNKDKECVAVVTGMSYGAPAVYDNLASAYPSQPEAALHQLELPPSGNSLYRIGLLHGTVDAGGEHDPYSPCTKDELMRKGYDYWALGHIHVRQVLSTSPYIVYSGNLQSRHVKETGAKGAYVVDVHGDHSTELAFHSLDHIRWVEEKVDMSGVDASQKASELLLQKVEECRDLGEGRHVFARLVLTGNTPLHDEFAYGSLIKELLELWKESEWPRLEAGEPVVWPIQMLVQSERSVNVDAWRGTDHFIGDVVRTTEELLLDQEERDQLVQESLSSFYGQRRLRQWLQGRSEDEQKAWVEQALHLVVNRLDQGERVDENK